MRLYLGGYYSAYAGGQRWVELALPAPAPLRDILAQFNIPPGEVVLVVMNGRQVEGLDITVSGEDEVRLLPPLDGGVNQV